MNISGVLQLGFVYALLALGVFISFRVMNTPDLTADGSFTLGLVVSTMAAAGGFPLPAILLGMLAGALAGTVTGLLQTKGGIHPILAGILTMTALYSVNLFILGGSPNVTLLGKETIFTLPQKLFPRAGRAGVRLAVTLLFAGAGLALLVWFFRTSLGLMMRAAGDNEKMVRSSSINTDVIRIAALAISNSFIALSGAVLAQYQGYADINAGTGIVIIGLASVILGELILHRGGIGRGLLSAAAGAVLYRFLVALALHLNVFPAYMFRFLSAFIVAAALGFPRLRELHKQYLIRKGNPVHAQNN
ncbi:MAG: ABC transporter permease [Spirochaetaceae bacterium]|jgi:putative ABC transport system permease protein|nr:ABC transporter permease [Spirochaetaceae bacterium]